jgi:hypothetical protein
VGLGVPQEAAKPEIHSAPCSQEHGFDMVSSYMFDQMFAISTISPCVFYPLAFSLYLLLSSNMASWKTPHFQTCSMFFSAIYLYLRGGFPAMFLFFPGFALANRMASSSPISMGISHFSSGNRGVSSWIFHF